VVFAVETKILRRFIRELKIHTDCPHHRRNLANNAGGESTMGNGNFTKEEFRRMGNIRLNQSLIYKTMGKEHRIYSPSLLL